MLSSFVQYQKFVESTIREDSFFNYSQQSLQTNLYLYGVLAVERENDTEYKSKERSFYDSTIKNIKGIKTTKMKSLLGVLAQVG